MLHQPLPLSVVSLEDYSSSSARVSSCSRPLTVQAAKHTPTHSAYQPAAAIIHSIDSAPIPFPPSSSSLSSTSRPFTSVPSSRVPIPPRSATTKVPHQLSASVDSIPSASRLNALRRHYLFHAPSRPSSSASRCALPTFGNPANPPKADSGNPFDSTEAPFIPLSPRRYRENAVPKLDFTPDEVISHLSSPYESGQMNEVFRIRGNNRLSKGKDKYIVKKWQVDTMDWISIKEATRRAKRSQDRPATQQSANGIWPAGSTARIHRKAKLTSTASSATAVGTPFLTEPDSSSSFPSQLSPSFAQSIRRQALLGPHLNDNQSDARNFRFTTAFYSQHPLFAFARPKKPRAGPDSSAAAGSPDHSHDSASASASAVSIPLLRSLRRSCPHPYSNRQLLAFHQLFYSVSRVMESCDALDGSSRPSLFSSFNPSDSPELASLSSLSSTTVTGPDFLCISFISFLPSDSSLHPRVLHRLWDYAIAACMKIVRKMKLRSFIGLNSAGELIEEEEEREEQEGPEWEDDQVSSEEWAANRDRPVSRGLQGDSPALSTLSTLTFASLHLRFPDFLSLFPTFFDAFFPYLRDSHLLSRFQLDSLLQARDELAFPSPDLEAIVEMKRWYLFHQLERKVKDESRDQKRLQRKEEDLKGKERESWTPLIQEAAKNAEKKWKFGHLDNEQKESKTAAELSAHGGPASPSASKSAANRPKHRIPSAHSLPLPAAGPIANPMSSA